MNKSFHFLQSTISRVSCPGKVLVSGGYAVLNPQYSGVVFSCSSRIRSESNFFPSEDERDDELRIQIFNDIFDNKMEEFVLVKNSELQIYRLFPLNPEFQNPFVTNSLLFTIPLLCSTKDIFSNNKVLQIKISADNEFYGKDFSEGRKTGLGSSACVVSSLISSILLETGFLSKENLQEKGEFGKEIKNFLYRLSFFVHSLCQGKIGSGFDISAAIFGSHLYKRPNNIEEMGRFMNKFLYEENEENIISVISSSDLEGLLDDFLMKEELWNETREFISLPSNLDFVFGNIEAGSKTPLMASRVNEWISSNPSKSKLIFQIIDDLNYEIVHIMKELNQLQNEKKKDKEEMNLLKELKKCSYEVRGIMKKLGEETGVEIEPDCQSSILDKLMGMECSIMSGVPGAGGFDAVFIVARGNEIDELLDFMEREVHELTPLNTNKDPHPQGLHIEV